MTHKTLIGGTAYSITGGRSMVSGTTYNITGGRTLVGGTGYNISFSGEKTAMLYSDGSLVFQEGADVESGKTLTKSYTGFETSTTAPPWHGQQNTFKTVSFNTEIAPATMYRWFYNATNMVANTHNFTNLNMNNVTDMYQTYENCSNLTGSPVCGSNVTRMVSTYENCYKLTGSPVCGNNVTNMSYAYYNCTNLTGGVFTIGASVQNAYQAYANCKNLHGNCYVYAYNIGNASRCFRNRSNANWLNIYVNQSDPSFQILKRNNASTSVVGANFAWTNYSTTSRMQNSKYKICIYYVDNVAAARIANGD